MTKQNRKSRPGTAGKKRNKAEVVSADTAGLRIIGGKFRGRKLLYSGGRRTRPMKDRLREAVFNLIGERIIGAHAIDLFAGTGALGLEALSRGAAKATLIEQHYPTADIIRKNISSLGVESQTELVTGNAFVWARRRRDLGTARWLVFCSPPYDYYVFRAKEMLELLAGLIRSAPDESILVVEADERFDFALLDDANAWEVRKYPPAIIGIYRKGIGNWGLGV
jgi:16S rRNA (guanine966-N2)-methyltransferase